MFFNIFGNLQILFSTAKVNFTWNDSKCYEVQTPAQIFITFWPPCIFLTFHPHCLKSNAKVSFLNENVSQFYDFWKIIFFLIQQYATSLYSFLTKIPKESAKFYWSYHLTILLALAINLLVTIDRNRIFHDVSKVR